MPPLWRETSCARERRAAAGHRSSEEAHDRPWLSPIASSAPVPICFFAVHSRAFDASPWDALRRAKGWDGEVRPRASRVGVDERKDVVRSRCTRS